MGKFDRVLLISDYDDTLYGTDLSVSEENRAAIARFIDQGGHFTVATGRAHTTFAPQISRERLTLNAPAILSNGSAVYDFAADKLLWQSFLPAAAPDHVSALTARLPSLGFEAYHGEDIYVHNPNIITQSHMERVGGHYTLCPIQEMPLPWTKLILQQDHAVLLEAQQWLFSHFGDVYEAIFSNRYLLEVTAKGSDKGQMALWVADRLGISRDHLYCVGDNVNDLPMLAVSAVPFAPSSCADEVKDWGAALLGSCDESCVAQLIGLLDARYPDEA